MRLCQMQIVNSAIEIWFFCSCKNKSFAGVHKKPAEKDSTYSEVVNRNWPGVFDKEFWYCTHFKPVSQWSPARAQGTDCLSRARGAGRERRWSWRSWHHLWNWWGCGRCVIGTCQEEPLPDLSPVPSHVASPHTSPLKKKKKQDQVCLAPETHSTFVEHLREEASRQDWKVCFIWQETSFLQKTR